MVVPEIGQSAVSQRTTDEGQSTNMQLRTLRSRLDQLRRRRAMVRHSTAWSALVLAVLWLVLAVFFIDVLMLMSIPQRRGRTPDWRGDCRLGVLAIHKAVVGGEGRCRRCGVVGRKESAHRQRSRGGPSIPRSGRPHMGVAAIGIRGDRIRRRIQPLTECLRGLYLSPLQTPHGLVGGTLAVVAGIVLLFPEYTQAFANRMLLGSMRYPADTRSTNRHQRRNRLVAGGKKYSLRIPYGTPLNFEVFGKTGNSDLPETRSNPSENQRHRQPSGGRTWRGGFPRNR